VRHIPGKGTTYIPNAYYRYTKEGFSEGYINSHGFRDYERAYEKPANKFRILVLGDSYVEGFQVALHDTFPAVLEKKLNDASTNTRCEVLNLGQSGFGTADEYMRYLNFGVKYSPDVVLVAFLTGNDFQDNSKFLDGGNLRFYFAFDKSGNLELDRSLVDEYEKNLTLAKRAFHYVKENSYLASLVSDRAFLLRLQLRDYYYGRSARRGQPKGAESAIPEFSPLNIYLANASDRWKDAFAVTKDLLRKFRHSVEANGSKFVLVTLSNAEQVHAELQRQLENEHQVSFDFDRPDRVIGEFAGQENINHLALMPLFRKYHLQTGTYLHGFAGSKGGHWNENGHRLAAEKIFEYLEEKAFVPLGSGKPWTAAAGLRH
jgi:lysophospholipase L1-like esterase